MLYLHIGSHKTGTSSIQSAFHEAREKLRKIGVNYFPYSANHSQAFIWRFSKQRFTHPVTTFHRMTKEDVIKKSDEVHNALSTFLSDNDISTKVISGEELSTFGRNDVLDMKVFLSKFTTDIRVILYVRNYYDYLNSELQELIKWGKTIPEFISTASVSQFLHPRFYQRYETYADVFGPENIVVRLMQNEVLYKGDLISDFCHVIGAEDAVCLLPRRIANPSLSQRSVDLISLYNSLRSRASNGSVINIDSSSAGRVLSDFRGEKFTVSEEGALSAYAVMIKDDSEKIGALLNEKQRVLLTRRVSSGSHSRLFPSHEDIEYLMEKFRLLFAERNAELNANQLLMEIIADIRSEKPAKLRICPALHRIDSLETCLRLGHGFMKLKRPDLAVICAERAIAIDGSDRAALSLLAKAKDLMPQSGAPN